MSFCGYGPSSPPPTSFSCLWDNVCFYIACKNFLVTSSDRKSTSKLRRSSTTYFRTHTYREFKVYTKTLRLFHLVKFGPEQILLVFVESGPKCSTVMSKGVLSSCRSQNFSCNHTKRRQEVRSKKKGKYGYRRFVFVQTEVDPCDYTCLM